MLDLSDRLEREDNKVVPHGISTLLAAIEVDSWNVVGYSREKKNDNDLLGDLVKYRKYNTNSVRDLLRVIRNKNDIGTLAKASFEETEKVLLNPALFCEVDPVTGVSANIMMGQAI